MASYSIYKGPESTVDPPYNKQIGGVQMHFYALSVSAFQLKVSPILHEILLSPSCNRLNSPCPCLLAWLWLQFDECRADVNISEI